MNHRQKKQNLPAVDFRKADELSKIFKILGSRNAFRAFEILLKQEKTTASLIAATLKISQAIAEKNLAMMADGKILKKSGSKNDYFYSINRSNKLLICILNALKNKRFFVL